MSTSPARAARTAADAWRLLRDLAAGDAVDRSGPWTAEAGGLLDLLLPVVDDRAAGRPTVVGHLAQSLDGRIAMGDGTSRWLSGDADLDHTHRLRALVDAVVVGAQTASRDDPRLTVRRVAGDDPLRVVLDPRGRVPRSHRMFTDGGPTLVMNGHRRLDPAAMLAQLAARGVRRVLVEGGGVTLGHFLAAGCVDRLHLVTAPVLLGEGTPSVAGLLGASLAACPRPRTRLVPLGDDWLYDCTFEG